MKKIFKPF